MWIPKTKKSMGHRKISRKNKDPFNHLKCNDIKITDKENIADQLTEQFSKKKLLFKKIKKNFKAEWKEKKTSSQKNVGKYNWPFNQTELTEANKSHDTAVDSDEVHYQFQKIITKIIS